MTSAQILIVDDNEAHRLIARRAAERLVDPSSVFESDSIANAQEVLSATSIAIVILDLNLNNESGLDLLPLVNQGTEVVVISTSDLQEDIDKCLKAGLSHYIPKGNSLPDFIDSLEATISKLL